MTVDELFARGAGVGGAPVRVGGPVAPGSITWNAATRTLAFRIQDNRRDLIVNYRALCALYPL